MQSNVSIALFMFKRPHVLKVIDGMRAFRPGKIYLVADGGRDDVEHAACLDLRKIACASIDWDAEVVEIFLDHNLGVDVIIPKIITEILKHEDRLIVLEDDCVPSKSFYGFCCEMLERYAESDAVLSVSGTNWGGAIYSSGLDYFYSHNFESFGWATWSRAWEKYSDGMTTYDEGVLSSRLRVIYNNSYLEKKIFSLIRRHYIATRDGDMSHAHWDGKWLYSHLVSGGLSIVPRVNMITNIGFDDSATHTNNPLSPLANNPRGELRFPLACNDELLANKDYDIYYARTVLGFGHINRIKSVIKVILGVD